MAGTLGFNVAAGMYQSTLNTVLQQVYNALYPDLLKGNIDINNFGISSVDFDIQAPPSVNLVPSGEANAHIKDAFETACDAKRAEPGYELLSTASSDKYAALERASSATFTANLSKLALTVYYANGSSSKIPSAPLVVHATITVDGSDSDMTVKILGATITVPDEPVMTELLNNALVPCLIKYLNTKILVPIKIPPITYQSLALSTPLLVVQQSYLTAFSALGSTPLTTPPPLPWPKDGIYIAIDISTIEAAARTIFPLKAQEKFSWEIFSGHVGATLKKLKISSINADGSINAVIKAKVSCHLKMKNSWPLSTISFPLSTTVSLAGTVRPLFEDGELKVILKGIPIPKFSFNWDIPSWIKPVFSSLEAGLTSALNDILGPLIAKVLNIHEIPIIKIPVIHIKFEGGKTINIAIDKAKPSRLHSLLVLTTKATISSES